MIHFCMPKYDQLSDFGVKKSMHVPLISIFKKCQFLHSKNHQISLFLDSIFRGDFWLEKEQKRMKL